MAPAVGSAGNPQQLESLLAAFTNPDNEARRRAEMAWEDLKQRLPDKVGRRRGLGVDQRQGAPPECMDIPENIMVEAWIYFQATGVYMGTPTSCDEACGHGKIRNSIAETEIIPLA